MIIIHTFLCYQKFHLFSITYEGVIQNILCGAFRCDEDTQVDAYTNSSFLLTFLNEKM